MRKLAWLLSWALYWCGHAVSRCIDRSFAYPLYNRLMMLSVRVQDYGGNGPWGKICEETDERKAG